jgi:hypothetical protein
MTEQETDKSILEFQKKLAESQEQLPAEFRKILSEHYWELLEND